MPEIVSAIQKQLESNRIPNIWLLIGEPGTGKTSLAYIISQEIQKGTGQAEIEEVNGAVNNGVDFARALVARCSKYNPMTGLYRVVIVNEIQRWTDEAQQALLVPTEDINSPTVYILTSTDPSKINEALLSRCGAATYKLKGLDSAGRMRLIEKAIKISKCLEPMPRIWKAIEEANVTSGRDIINAVEIYANGVPPELAVQSTDVDPQYMEIAKLVMTGNWNKIAPVLRKLKPADAKPLRQIISGLGRNQLLTGGQNCVTLLKELALYTAFQEGIDLSALFAIIYGYCQKVGGK